jgi:hypothetical protein
MGLKIFHQNLVYNIGDSFTASKEAASMPGANLAGLHPSEPWNCPSYTNAEYVRVDLLRAYDISWAAIIGTDLKAERNLLKESVTLSVTPWADTLCTTADVITGTDNGLGPIIDNEGMTISFSELTESGTGEHYAQQSVTMATIAGSTTSDKVRYAASIFWDSTLAGTENRYPRLRVEGASASDFAYTQWNGSTGAYNADSEGGSFTVIGTPGNAESISTSGSNTWVRAGFVFETDRTETTLKFRIQMLTNAYVANYASSSKKLRVAGPQLEVTSCPSIDSGYDKTTYSDYAITDNYRGGLWRIETSDSTTSGTNSMETGWLHVGMNTDDYKFSQDVGFTNSLRDLRTSNAPMRGRYLWLHASEDDSNTTDFSVGVLVACSDTYAPTNDIKAGSFSIKWMEASEQSESTSGHFFRNTSGVYRDITFSLYGLSKSEALGDLDRIRRYCGLSIPILIIVDSDEADYRQQYLVYGFIKDVGEIRHIGANYFEHQFTILELIP